jgi:hypothetical protein
MTPVSSAKARGSAGLRLIILQPDFIPLTELNDERQIPI